MLEVSVKHGMGVDHITVKGFTQAELNELASMEYKESRRKVIEMLDERCCGLGSEYRKHDIYVFHVLHDKVIFDVGV